MNHWGNRKDRKKIVLDTVYYSACCVLLIVFGYFLVQSFRCILEFDTPKELREMTTVAVAHQFAQGKNPYAYSVLANEIPSVTSIYGLLVPLLMAPFIWLFSSAPLSALQVCQLLTLVMETVGTVFFYRLLHKKTENVLLALCGAFLFQSCYWRYSAFGGAFPDQWGLTLSVILMDCIHTDEKKERYRPLLYSVVVIGLFYCKQYFILILIGLCVYLFLYSGKDLIRFLIYGAFLGGLSVIAIWRFFPLYFAEVFPIAHGQTITGVPAYSLAQIKDLSLYYGPVVVFCILGFILNFYDMIRKRSLRGEVSYELCQIIFILPPLFHIAENQGTNYTYYLQLWYPNIILYGVYFAAVFAKSARRKLTDIMGGGKKILTEISFWAVCLMCICSLVRVLPSYRCQLLSQKQRQSWQHAYDILDRCSEEGEILVSMILSNYCIERGIATSNYGQAEYNNLQNLENYKSSKLWRNLFLFDHTEAVLQKNISYNQIVREKIYDRSYRCIALVYAGEYHLAEDDLIKAGYHVLDAEELATGEQSWYTVFYTVD